MNLTEIEIKKLIEKDLNGWELIDSKLVKFIPSVSGKSLGDIVKNIWDYAEKVDHHPDILLTYSGIQITLFTHDKSGITEKDMKFALNLRNLY